MDWFSARHACRNLGGRLVSLETQNEYSVVAAFTSGGQRPHDIRLLNIYPLLRIVTRYAFITHLHVRLGTNMALHCVAS